MVGNVMIDSLFHHLQTARSRGLPDRLDLERSRYVLVTLHRPSNVDEQVNLRNILGALAEVARAMPVIFPVHPRTRKNAGVFGLAPELAALRTIEPLGYVDMLSLTDGAAVCLTDSGGLQEETTALGVPCVTLRERTERPSTITQGTNRMVPWPPTKDGVVASFRRALGQGRVPVGSRVPEGWDGHAADRIVTALAEPGGSSRFPCH
jgi:UDP-N-acetylglucosamine 2-epimerase (non-hydrolysing)